MAGDLCLVVGGFAVSFFVPSCASHEPQTTRHARLPYPPRFAGQSAALRAELVNSGWWPVTSGWWRGPVAEISRAVES